LDREFAERGQIVGEELAEKREDNWHRIGRKITYWQIICGKIFCCKRADHWQRIVGKKIS